MSKVLEYMRDRNPALRDQPDDLVTAYAGDRYPNLLGQDPEFKKDYERVTKDRTALASRAKPVVRQTAPGSLTSDDVVPAIRLIGGKVISGRKGDTHPDIINREELAATDIDQRGFADKAGAFYDRESAANALQIPTKFEPGRLHSTDLHHAAPKTSPEGQHAIPRAAEALLKPAPPQPPTFEQPAAITEQGPIFPSAIEEARYGAIRSPQKTEADELLGLPPGMADQIRASRWGRGLLGPTETERSMGRMPESQPGVIPTVLNPAFPFGPSAERVAGKVLLTAFIAQFAASVPDAYRSFTAAVKRGDWQEAGKIATEFGFGAAFTALAGKGLHEEFRRWTTTADNADTFRPRGERPTAPEEKKKNPIDLAKEEIRRKGPTPEQNALFNRLDPEVAGTTYEKVVEYAKSLGLDESHVVKPESMKKSETAAESLEKKPEEAAKPAPGTKIDHPLVGQSGTVEKKLTTTSTPVSTPVTITSIEHGETSERTGRPTVVVKLSNGESMIVTYGKDKYGNEKSLEEGIKDAINSLGVKNLGAKPAEPVKPAAAPVAEPPKAPEIPARPEGQSDYDRYQALIKMVPQSKGDTIKKLFAEIEQIKNLHGGFPPKATTAEAPKPEAPKPPTPAPTAPKPETTPAAPPKPTEPPAEAPKPTAPSADVEKLLKVEEPDVTEARTRVKAFQGQSDDLKRQFGEVDQKIRELEKRILNTRGRARGKIKSATSATDRKLYADLQKQRGDLRTQMVTLDQLARKDRDAVEAADDARIINDPKQPLLRRLDRLYRRQGSTDPTIAKALSEETYRVIREKYPDATDEELQRLAPQVQRAAYFGEDIWKSHDVPKLEDLRRGALEAALQRPDVMPFSEFPQELKDRIHRYTTLNRPYAPQQKPVENLSAAELADLKKAIAEASEQVRKQHAERTAAAEKAKKEAEAAEEKLLVEAQKVADSAGKPGTKGGRTAKEVRDDLVARIKGALDKLIANDKVKLEKKEGNDYVASGESGGAALGTIEEEGGKFTVSVAPVSDFTNKVSATFDTQAEAEWMIKAMAAKGFGKAVIGVPGDGVFRIWNSGPELLGVWKSARAIDISKAKKAPYVSRGGAEAPPKSIKTKGDWEEAKAYHELRDSDTIHDWSPALNKLAKGISPDHPEWITADYVDRWIEAKNKGEEPPPLTEPPKEPAPKPPTQPPAEIPKPKPGKFKLVLKPGQMDAQIEGASGTLTVRAVTTENLDGKHAAIELIAFVPPGLMEKSIPGPVVTIKIDRPPLGVSAQDAREKAFKAFVAQINKEGFGPTLSKGKRGAAKPPEPEPEDMAFGGRDRGRMVDFPSREAAQEYLATQQGKPGFGNYKVTIEKRGDKNFELVYEKQSPSPAAPVVPPTGEAPPSAGAPAPKGGPLITKERADAIRERLKKRLAESGAPPEEVQDIESLEDIEDIESLEAKQPSAKKLAPQIFSDAVQLGSYYIQSGLHKFEPWAKQMRADFGEAIEPYLKAIYETARVTIESPSGEAGGNLRSPGLQPGLRPPTDRIDDPRKQFTRPYSEHGIPAELLPHLDKHQRHGVSLALYSLHGRGGFLLADGTGVGKTRQALAIAHSYSKLPGTKVIIITRAETIKPNWQKNTFGGSYFHDAQAMGVKVKLAKDAIVSPGEIGITTYENAQSVNRHSDPNTILIWDEAHSLKNKSQRGMAGDKANSKAKAVLFMSATPADKPEHIYYLTRMGIMEGKSESQQLKDLGMMIVKMDKLVKDEQTGQMVKRRVHFWAPDPKVSDRDREERFNGLFDRMTQQGSMIKREISMQGVHVQVLRIALPPEGHETLQEILHFFEADTIDDLKGIKKAIALGHLRRQQEPFKIAPTVLLTQRELDAGRQVVVFVSRVNESEVGKWVKGPGDMKIREVLMSSEGTAKALRDAMHEAGIHDIAEIHGEADQHSLEAMADFQSGKKRVIIATIESGGTGINLDDVVGNRPRTMVVVTAPFDAVGNVQAAGRIWRLKTLSGANMFYLFGDTDVDQWNADIIGSKMSLLGAVVEGAVKKLDISNPDAVSTDDFHGGGKKSSTVAPGAKLPKLDWQPFTTKAGNQVFVATLKPNDPFWQWWRAHGQAANPLGLKVGKYKDNWQVWAKEIPKEEPAAPPAGEQPPLEHKEPEPAEAGTGPGFESRPQTDTGLPPGVDAGGPDFARELMEASRRVETTVRSKVNLRAGVLGHYIPARASIARSDKIEVGDIRNQGTVAHEMGHDFDALLFPSVWAVGGTHIYSQESLKERIPTFTGTKKQLFDELVAVSELMRGPISAGSPGHQRYRKRAAELIADWFSLYVHDPDKARAMAPEWTKGFEVELAKDQNAKDTVDQLHRRTVTPVSGPPPPNVPPTGGATGMPGAVPPRPESFTPRDTAAALAAEQMVKDEVRRFEAEKQRARIRSEQWRKMVPKQADRNDVGAFVEGTRNLEIPGDTIDAVRSRMTPAKQELAKEYRFQMELQRQRINQYLLPFEESEYLAYLENYLPHVYVNARTPGGKEAIARFKKNSPNAKERKIPTLAEAVGYGLIPISQDPAVLAEVHARINWQVATNRRFLAKLNRLRTSQGDPVIVPKGKNPGGWPESNNPLIMRTYAHMTPGGLQLWRGGAAIHPDVWNAVRQILEVPIRSNAGRLYDAINGFSRANAFAFSGFHDLTLRFASTGAMGRSYNPLRGIFMAFEKDPKTGELRILQSTRKAGREMLSNQDIVADAALHGLRFSWTESESYQHEALNALDRLAANWRSKPVAGKAVKVAAAIQHWRHQFLWRDTHDALKLMAYHDLVNKALSEAPENADTKAVKETIASLLNDAFGGQEWQTKFWLSPQMRLFMSRGLLAPDWTLSTLRSVPGLSDVASRARAESMRFGGRGPEHTHSEGWSGHRMRSAFWAREITAIMIATIAAQWAIYQLFGRKEKGDKPWIWENEAGQGRRIDVTPLMRHMPWKTGDDPTRYYVNLGKRPEEILNWFIHPMHNLQSKLARPIIESVRQLSGYEGDFPMPWKREHETFPEEVGSRTYSALSEMFVPFTFSGNQFALSLPYRKGMSRYKAQQAFESAYEIVATPGKVAQYAKSLFRGHISTDMNPVLDEIRDAAARNGVNVREVERNALSKVRSLHYSAYNRAVEQNDEKTIRQEQDALERLGATQGSINRSVRRHERLKSQ